VRLGYSCRRLWRSLPAVKAKSRNLDFQIKRGKWEMNHYSVTAKNKRTGLSAEIQIMANNSQDATTKVLESLQDDWQHACTIDTSLIACCVPADELAAERAALTPVELSTITHDVTDNGIAYQCKPGGPWDSETVVTLFRKPSDTDAQIEDAKEELERYLDVYKFETEMIK
jgi:hypothetical protein